MKAISDNLEHGIDEPVKAISDNLDHRIDEPVKAIPTDFDKSVKTISEDFNESVKAMSDALNHRIDEPVKGTSDRFAHHFDNSAKRISGRSDKTVEETFGGSEEIAKEKLDEVSEPLGLKKSP